MVPNVMLQRTAASAVLSFPTVGALPVFRCLTALKKSRFSSASRLRRCLFPLPSLPTTTSILPLTATSAVGPAVATAAVSDRATVSQKRTLCCCSYSGCTCTSLIDRVVYPCSSNRSSSTFKKYLPYCATDAADVKWTHVFVERTSGKALHARSREWKRLTYHHHHTHHPSCAAAFSHTPLTSATRCWASCFRSASASNSSVSFCYASSVGTVSIAPQTTFVASAAAAPTPRLAATSSAIPSRSSAYATLSTRAAVIPAVSSPSTNVACAPSLSNTAAAKAASAVWKYISSSTVSSVDAAGSSMDTPVACAGLITDISAATSVSAVDRHLVCATLSTDIPPATALSAFRNYSIGAASLFTDTSAAIAASSRSKSVGCAASSTAAIASGSHLVGLSSLHPCRRVCSTYLYTAAASHHAPQSLRMLVRSIVSVSSAANGQLHSSASISTVSCALRTRSSLPPCTTTPFPSPPLPLPPPPPPPAVATSLPLVVPTYRHFALGVAAGVPAAAAVVDPSSTSFCRCYFASPTSAAIHTLSFKCDAATFTASTPPPRINPLVCFMSSVCTPPFGSLFRRRHSHAVVYTPRCGGLPQLQSNWGLLQCVRYYDSRWLHRLERLREPATYAEPPSIKEVETIPSDHIHPLLRSITPSWNSRRCGVLGYKVGMMSLWDGWGERHPITVVQVDRCVVLDNRTLDKDGYEAVVLGIGYRPLHRVSKPLLGHYMRANVEPKQRQAEFKCSSDCLLPVGHELSVRHFSAGQYVFVSGFTKEKGYLGVNKRWGFAGCIPGYRGSVVKISDARGKSHYKHNRNIPLHYPTFVPQPDVPYPVTMQCPDTEDDPFLYPEIPIYDKEQ